MTQDTTKSAGEISTLKKRGRPSTGNAMTNAQRQKAYRQRLRSQLYEIDPKEITSRVTLVKQLAQALEVLDKPDYPYREGAEWSAANLVAEIVTRYNLSAPLKKLQQAKRVTK